MLQKLFVEPETVAATQAPVVKPKRRLEPLSLFLPNRIVARPLLVLVAVVQALLFLGLWIASPFKVLPNPMDVAAALQRLWLQQGLGRELATSFALNLEALGLASVLSLGLAYLTTIPFMRPLVAALSKGRFLSLTGFTLIFHARVGRRARAETGPTGFRRDGVFTSLRWRRSFNRSRVRNSITRAPLRMSEARVIWEVVILGTLSQAFEVLRQNAAIGWMMLTLVEGIVRGEGGIGALLLNENKHFLLAEVFAIQLVILSFGLLQDYGLQLGRKLACPYADLTRERQ